MKKLIFYSISFILFQILIVFLAVSKNTFFSGIIIHFIAVFTSVILLYLALSHDFIQIHKPGRKAALYGIVISILGEVVQVFISYRTFDQQDIVTGIVATIIASVAILIKQDFF